jgi:hypothetical protein
VYVDPQSSLGALKNLFPGALIDDSGTFDYVPKPDIKIRRIKELYRAIKNSLPWKLPSSFFKYLVGYAISRINIHRTSLLSTPTSPYQLFTGTKIDYQKSLALGFGDYCEDYDGSDNTSRSRSIPCIALNTSNNSTGSWQFYNMTTGAMVRRLNWRQMVTTQAVVDKINFMIGVVDELEIQPEIQAAPETQPTPELSLQVEQEEGLINANQDVAAETIEEIVNEEPVEPQGQDATAVEQPQVVRCSERITREVSTPSRYVLLTKIQQTTKKWMLSRRNPSLKPYRKKSY